MLDGKEDSIAERHIFVSQKPLARTVDYRLDDMYIIVDEFSERKGKLGILGSQEYTSEEVEAMS